MKVEHLTCPSKLILILLIQRFNNYISFFVGSDDVMNVLGCLIIFILLCCHWRGTRKNLAKNKVSWKQKSVIFKCIGSYFKVVIHNFAQLFEDEWRVAKFFIVRVRKSGRRRTRLAPSLVKRRGRKGASGRLDKSTLNFREKCFF